MPSWYICGNERYRGPVFAAAAGGGAYTAQGISFDGGDHLFLDTFGGSPSDSKVMTCSFWFWNKADSSNQIIFDSQSAGFSAMLRISTVGDGVLKVQARDTGATVNLDFTTSTNYFQSSSQSAYKHIMMSVDLATATIQIYVNNVSDTASVATLTNSNIGYSAMKYNGFGGDAFAAACTGWIADFYLNIATAIDLSNSTNRAKFISAGNPVDLGSTGAIPTGTSPLIYFSGVVGSWHVNKNTTAGGFTVDIGALSAAGSSPP